RAETPSTCGAGFQPAETEDRRCAVGQGTCNWQLSLHHRVKRRSLKAELQLSEPQAETGDEARVDVESRSPVQELHLAVEHPAHFAEAGNPARFRAQPDQSAVVGELNLFVVAAGRFEADLIRLDVVFDPAIDPRRRPPPVAQEVAD